MLGIERHRHPLALLLSVVTAGVVIGAFVAGLHLEQAGAGDELGEWILAMFAPGFLVPGWWLTTHRPRLVLGWLLLAAALTIAVAGLAAGLAGVALADGRGGIDWWLWVFSWLWQPHGTLLSIAFVLFPDGVVRSPGQRRLVVALTSVTAASMLGSALLPGPIITTPDKLDGALPGVTNPIGINALEPITDPLFALFYGLSFLVGLATIVWLIARWRRSAGVRRRQFRWVTLLQLGWMVVVPLAMAVPGPAGAGLAVLLTFVQQGLLVIAITQWQAFEVDVVVRRAVLAGVTLAAGLAVYAVVVAVVSSAVAGNDAGSWPTTLGAAAAIVTFGPLSVVIRRGVNRLFYGRRDDPYVVVTETSRRLTGAADPIDGVAATLVSLTDQLRNPYAAVVDIDGSVVTVSGSPLDGDEATAIPILHQGSPRGTLLVGHRRGSMTMTRRELILLEDVAAQLGPALAAVDHIEGIRAAQSALVAARDDERLRIQRDLHDGLGSAMTAITLKLAAAANHLDREETTAAQPLVRGARDDIERALVDVRRLVYSLGDPTAPPLRLADALAEDIAHIAAATALHLTVDLAGLPDLTPSAAEDVRRIVGEAVTNVVRHANAKNCTVRARANGDMLQIAVEDDGVGVGERPAGVGRATMIKRAQQVGATLKVADRPGAGTSVTLTLLNGTPR